MISINGTEKIIAATERNSAEIGQPKNFAVVDARGILIADERMDGAWIGSIEMSTKKAFPLCAFEIATKNLAKQSQPAGQFFGIDLSNDGKVIAFAGGVTLNDQVVGTIGVSDGSGDLDKAVADAGAAAFQKENRGKSNHVDNR